jgi:hypothetical protein
MLKSILSAAFWSDVLGVIIAIMVGGLIVAWVTTKLRRRGWDFA